MAGLNQYTKLLLHCDGANASTAFIDATSRHANLTVNGDAQVSTTAPKWGTGAALFDGTTDFLTSPDHADWDICGQTNFTLDFQVKQTNLTSPNTIQYYIAQGANSSNQWFVGKWTNNAVKFDIQTGAASQITLVTGNNAINDITTWHHVAVIKVGTLWGIYVDGTQLAYASDASADTYNGLLHIGCDLAEAIYFFNGRLDEIRIQHNNYFNAAPNIGLTNTITAPVSVYASTGHNFGQVIY